MPKQLFATGQVVTTPGAIDALSDIETLARLLQRHTSGDWGELSHNDKRMNDAAVKGGDRILSAYKTPNGTRIWIITEHDRSVTTLLLPSEY
jgi:hypothetical protein